jgi:hypothetical protein
LGTIEQGSSPIVVAHETLEDIGNARKIRAVILRGKFLDRQLSTISPTENPSHLQTSRDVSPAII